MLLTEAEIKKWAGGVIFDRGDDYFEGGVVTEIIQRGQSISAEVEGSQYDPYVVTIRLDNEGQVTDSDCDCPYDDVCKHIVAVLLTLIRNPAKVSQRELVDNLLAQLPDEHLRRVLQLVLAEYPSAMAIVEQEVELVRNQSPTAIIPPPPAAPSVAPLPSALTADIVRDMRQAFRELERDHGRGGYGGWDYYHDEEGIDLCGIILPHLEELPTWLEQEAWPTAEAILRTITNELLDGWDVLDLWVKDSHEYALDDAHPLLDVAWAELFLSQPADELLEEDWLETLSDWEDEFGSKFALSRAALSQGWTYPPLVRVLNGHITAHGAWEEDAPSYAGALTRTRLCILARQERYQEYLYLAEAEGEHALFLAMLVKQGELERAVQEANRLYDENLSGLLRFVKMLHEAGHTAVALQTAQWGLGLPEYTPPTDYAHVAPESIWRRSKQELAAWLYQQAEAAGEIALALQAAEIAFLHHGTLNDYQAVQRLAGEAWSQYQQRLRPHIGQSANAVRIFLLEGMLPEAIAAFEKSSWGHGVSVLDMVEATQAEYPDWAIAQCVKPAERIMDGGKASHYAEAAQWLQRAHDVYQAHGRGADWQAYLAQLLAKHGRKYKLVPMLKGIG